jgi:hypothetical protein
MAATQRATSRTSSVAPATALPGWRGLSGCPPDPMHGRQNDSSHSAGHEPNVGRGPGDSGSTANTFSAVHQRGHACQSLRSLRAAFACLLKKSSAAHGLCRLDPATHRTHLVPDEFDHAKTQRRKESVRPQHQCAEPFKQSGLFSFILCGFAPLREAFDGDRSLGPLTDEVSTDFSDFRRLC